MCDRPTQCQAIKEHSGDYVCNRCGLYWDAGDEAPPCKTWTELNQEKEIRKDREFNQSREHGRQCLKKIREDLKL